MPSPLLPDLSADPLKSEPRVSLVIVLVARPCDDLSHNISRLINQPCALIGYDNEMVLRLNDPGVYAAETLARRLLKIKGVKRVKAARVCTRRGTIFAISLQSSAR